MLQRYQNSLNYYNEHKEELESHITTEYFWRYFLGTIFDNNALEDVPTGMYFKGLYTASQVLKHFLDGTGDNVSLNIENEIERGGVRHFVYNTILNSINEARTSGVITIPQLKWGSDNNNLNNNLSAKDCQFTYGTLRIEWETNGNNVVMFVNDIYSFDVSDYTNGRASIHFYKDAIDLVLAGNASDFYFVGKTGEISLDTIRERTSDNYTPNGDSTTEVYKRN